MFPDLPQKVKSGLLRLLWSTDPFKAKWAILAKAYSVIRDQHAGQVSLDTFLNLNGPFIGIITQADYLRVMGLEVVVGADKKYSLVHVAQTPGFDQSDVTTNVSVDDVVGHCYQAGYVAGHTAPTGAGLAMAVSAQNVVQGEI
jgi:hypothetical protein